MASNTFSCCPLIHLRLRSTKDCPTLRTMSATSRGGRMTRRMPSVAGEQPIGGLAFQPAPVDAQRLEQLGTEHDITVLASLASPDMNDHALAVDVADLQVRHFCATCARGIEGHQQNAMKRKLCRVD